MGKVAELKKTAREVMENVWARAQAAVEDGQHITPAAFLCRRGTMGVMGLPFSSEEEKDLAMEALKFACTAVQPDIVVVGGEFICIHAEGESAPDFMKNGQEVNVVALVGRKENGKLISCMGRISETGGARKLEEPYVWIDEEESGQKVEGGLTPLAWEKGESVLTDLLDGQATDGPRPNAPTTSTLQ